jgi:hypothetical protein
MGPERGIHLASRYLIISYDQTLIYSRKMWNKLIKRQCKQTLSIIIIWKLVKNDLFHHLGNLLSSFAYGEFTPKVVSRQS